LVQCSVGVWSEPVSQRGEGRKHIPMKDVEKHAKLQGSSPLDSEEV